MLLGCWSGDQRNGRGVYTYANGDTYNGEWCDNLRHGQGTYQFADTGAKVILQLSAHTAAFLLHFVSVQICVYYLFIIIPALI